jgi:death-on-curing protein
MQPIPLADLMLVAERVLGVPAEALVGATRLGAAGSALAAPFAADGQGRDRYPGLAEKAAILCSRLIRNHALPDGNKRVAFVCMLELLARNGAHWSPPADSDAEIADTVARLAARELSEGAFVRWVSERVAVGE